MSPTHTKSGLSSCQEDSAGSSPCDFRITMTDVDSRHIPGFADHERVVCGIESTTGLHAYVAIHSTALGPALGGCRMWNYADETAALTDVLRLSEGMSYKHAVAQTGRGGGKAVIMRDPHVAKTPELFRAFGRLVNALQGSYITAEDVGVTVDDMTAVRESTEYVAGLPIALGGSGDPSPYTAWGVFCGLQSAVRFHLRRSDLQDVVVAVQGAGHVGSTLCRHLHAAGARLIVADIVAANTRRVREEFGAEIVEVEQIYDAPADVFAPCALGGAINASTAARLQCRVVAGAANNQLASPDMAELLQQRNILWAPDFVINAGGIINISYEARPYDPRAAKEHASRIADVLTEIFEQSQATGQTTAAIANRLAHQNLAPTLGAKCVGSPA